MAAHCTNCHAALDPQALAGLCPRCLLAQALPLERFEETTPHGVFVPPTPAELAPLFPHLEILDLLGQGGMGAVYKARQVKLDRLVALKILPPGAAAEPGFADRFTREARALAKLSHPNIVAVHDFGEAGGVYYLLMEFVEGVNLRQSLSAGRLQPRQALTLVGEVCAALQYAHDMGVVHRDIKPENVLLDRQGHAKIADFGLAKLVGAAQPPARLTGTQQAMGTPHYMAPEQWERPLEVDHRADIYSLGVVFYELLTGELPLGKFAPPSAKAGGDARLDQVVLRAMEKEPAQRYQQMSEMKSAVESVDRPAPAEAAPPVPLNWGFEMAVTAIMVTAAFVGWAGLALVPHAKTLDNNAPWLFVTILVILFFSDGGNRYLRRAWSVGFFTLAFTSFICEATGKPHPLSLPGGCWVWLFLLGFFWTAAERFINSFKPAPAWQSVGGATPIPGLSATEDAIRRLLLRAVENDSFHSQLSVLPDIDSELLYVVREGCAVPAADRVLGVLDLSGGADPDRAAPEALPAVVIGCQGVYWRNGGKPPRAGFGKMSYLEMPARQFVNHGDSVFLGKGQYIDPNEEETGVTAEALTGFLFELREVLGST